MRKNKRNSIKQLVCLLLILVISIKGMDLVMNSKFENSIEYSFMNNKVNVNHNEIYYHEQGQGDKTVIFMSGSGVSSVYIDMYELWNEISKTSKIFIYDRPGMGKSTVTDKLRDIDTIVEEFRKVLELSGQKEPYILVSHSMASLEAIRFTQLYPKKVESIIFIDGASPKFCEDFNDPIKTMMYVLKWGRETGLLRILSNFSSIRSQFETKQNIPEELQELNLNITLKNLWNKSMINERKAIQKNGEKVKKNGQLGAIKTTVISAGKNGFDNWDEYQKELLKLSDNAKHIYIQEAGHFIHHEYPQMIIDVIKDELTN